MPKCRCGAESNRTRTTYDSRTGDVKEEICPSCKPEEFDRFRDPSDKKLWQYEVAHPDMYYKAMRGNQEVLVAKDKLHQDTYDIINADYDKDEREAAIARKRATRRTTPMTQQEKEAADRAWRPLVEQRQREHEQSIAAYGAQIDAIKDKYSIQ